MLRLDGAPVVEAQPARPAPEAEYLARCVVLALHGHPHPVPRYKDDHSRQRTVPRVRTSRIDHSRMPPPLTWRDVVAAYLVHWGISLAGPRVRHDMAVHLAAELRAEVAARMSADLAADLARHKVTRADVEAGIAPCVVDAEARLTAVRDERGEVG